MEKYLLDSTMIAIQMCDVDVVLGVQWLQSLESVALNFQELFVRFSSEGKEIELRGIKGNPSQLIISKNMTKLLKKGHHGVLVQLCSLDVQKSRPYVQADLQNVINNHSKVFEEIPKGLSPSRNHDHVIHLHQNSL
jgi:hypothetical protein